MGCLCNTVKNIYWHVIEQPRQNESGQYSQNKAFLFLSKQNEGGKNFDFFSLSYFVETDTFLQTLLFK